MINATKISEEFRKIYKQPWEQYCSLTDRFRGMNIQQRLDDKYDYAYQVIHEANWEYELAVYEARERMMRVLIEYDKNRSIYNNGSVDPLL